jgi:hypothetical protein
MTGVVSGLIVLATSFVIEDKARRVRNVWRRSAAGARRRGLEEKVVGRAGFEPATTD